MSRGPDVIYTSSPTMSVPHVMHLSWMPPLRYLPMGTMTMSAQSSHTIRARLAGAFFLAVIAHVGEGCVETLFFVPP